MSVKEDIWFSFPMIIFPLISSLPLCILETKHFASICACVCVCVCVCV